MIRNDKSGIRGEYVDVSKRNREIGVDKTIRMPLITRESNAIKKKIEKKTFTDFFFIGFNRKKSDKSSRKPQYSYEG